MGSRALKGTQTQGQGNDLLLSSGDYVQGRRIESMSETKRVANTHANLQSKPFVIRSKR